MESDLYWTPQNSGHVVELIFSSSKFDCLPSTLPLVQAINKVALLEGSNIIDLINDNDNIKDLLLIILHFPKMPLVNGHYSGIFLVTFTTDKP